MNQLDKDLIQTLLNNEPLLNAVKKVFIKEIEDYKPHDNNTDDNEILGAKYRGYMNAKVILESCFRQLESYRVEKNPRESINEAR